MKKQIGILAVAFLLFATMFAIPIGVSAATSEIDVSVKSADAIVKPGDYAEYEVEVTNNLNMTVSVFATHVLEVDDGEASHYSVIYSPSDKATISAYGTATIYVRVYASQDAQPETDLSLQVTFTTNRAFSDSVEFTATVGTVESYDSEWRNTPTISGDLNLSVDGDPDADSHRIYDVLLTNTGNVPIIAYAEVTFVDSTPGTTWSGFVCTGTSYANSGGVLPSASTANIPLGYITGQFANEEVLIFIKPNALYENGTWSEFNFTTYLKDNQGNRIDQISTIINTTINARRYDIDVDLVSEASLSINPGEFGIFDIEVSGSNDVDEDALLTVTPVFMDNRVYSVSKYSDYLDEDRAVVDPDNPMFMTFDNLPMNIDPLDPPSATDHWLLFIVDIDDKVIGDVGHPASISILQGEENEYRVFVVPPEDATFVPGSTELTTNFTATVQQNGLIRADASVGTNTTGVEPGEEAEPTEIPSWMWYVGLGAVAAVVVVVVVMMMRGGGKKGRKCPPGQRFDSKSGRCKKM